MLPMWTKGGLTAQRAPQHCSSHNSRRAMHDAPAYPRSAARLASEPEVSVGPVCAVARQGAVRVVLPASASPTRCAARQSQAAMRHGSRAAGSMCAAAADVHTFADGSSDSSGDGSSSADDLDAQVQQPTDAHLTAVQDPAALAAEEVSPQEAQRRLRRAADLLGMVHLMAPSNPETFNRALILWTAIRDVPPHMRVKLLDMISAEDIKRLWKTSEQRYVADAAAAQAAIGQSYSQWQDFPDDVGEVAAFEGRAAVPLSGLAGALRLDRFQKCFFLHPDSEELLGRVDVAAGPLGNALYPLYFAATLGSSIIPATREVADMQLEYADPAQLSLSAADLPESSWPRPRPPRWPFDGGLSDYMRAVGPGVYVGVGWKAPRPGKDAGRRFLTFMLVRRP